MTTNYVLTGMTCGSCEAKVKNILENQAGVSAVSVSKENNNATITSTAPLNVQQLQEALGGANSKYKITEPIAQSYTIAPPQTTTWLETYKPILLIFFYITIVAFVGQYGKGSTFHYMKFMRIFMAGFFLVFSFFKFLNLKGFAQSYAMYDIIAKRIPAWGYLYAFIELILGILYLTNFKPFITNSITLIVMSISIIGVLQAVFNKTKIQCACLGTVFNLPMSTVTIIEDALMIVMSAIMLL